MKKNIMILAKINKILKRNLKKLSKNVGQKKVDHLMNQNSFFCVSKRNFMFEPYIDNLEFQNRKAVSKLRLSDHKFPIEKLRYENKKREERLCEICNLNDI